MLIPTTVGTWPASIFLAGFLVEVDEAVRVLCVRV